MDLYEIRRLEWAMERADFRNVNMNADGVGWMADDFLGRGDRAARAVIHQQNELQRKREEMISKRDAQRANIRLQNLKDEDVPEWAKEVRRNSEEKQRKRKVERINGQR